MRLHWFSTDMEILLDLDKPADRQKFEKLISKCAVIREYSLVPSLRRGHYHALVTLSKYLPPLERIKLSRRLGSDRRRANADRARHEAGIYGFQLLIKEQVERNFILNQ